MHQSRHERERREDDPGSSARERAPPPGSTTEQPLQVLPCGNEQGFAVHLLQPPQPESAQPMPVFRLGEERFHPDLPLADRFLVRLRRVVAADLLQIIDIERALYLAAVVAGRAL